jgi:hypothetical protein
MKGSQRNASQISDDSWLRKSFGAVDPVKGAQRDCAFIHTVTAGFRQPRPLAYCEALSLSLG